MRKMKLILAFSKKFCYHPCMNLGTLHWVCKLIDQKLKNVFYLHMCPALYIISSQINVNCHEIAFSFHFSNVNKNRLGLKSNITSWSFSNIKVHFSIWPLPGPAYFSLFNIQLHILCMAYGDVDDNLPIKGKMEEFWEPKSDIILWLLNMIIKS